MATPPMAISTPASMIALEPLLSRRWLKIQPNVTVSINIGTTIIMFRMPM